MKRDFALSVKGPVFQLALFSPMLLSLWEAGVSFLMDASGEGLGKLGCLARLCHSWCGAELLNLGPRCAGAQVGERVPWAGPPG